LKTLKRKRNCEKVKSGLGDEPAYKVKEKMPPKGKADFGKSKT